MNSTAACRKVLIANQNGFNLIEVLAGITIVAIIAVGLTASTITTIRSNAVSRDAIAASTLAQDRVEQLLAIPPAQLSQLRTGSEVISGQPGSPEFTRQWAVAPGPTAGLMQVSVSVRWNASVPRSLGTVAYLCRAPVC
jgi:prepilin-type N-terminal cleavage/methylation domain-containing protein